MKTTEHDMSFAVRGLGAEYPWWFKPVRYITHVIMFGTIGAGACALIQRAISLCLVFGGQRSHHPFGGLQPLTPA